MKRIIQFSIQNKLAIWLLTILVVAGGMYAGTRMKMETLPNINAPVATITTSYPGATPEEISDKITQPIEKRVKSLPGVKTVRSTTALNMSSIQVEYDDFGQDMDQAVEDLRNAIDKISLPENIEKPEVAKVSLNDFPILALSVSGENQSLEKLSKSVKESLVQKLEDINGVYSVEISGQQVEEIHLKYKEDQLKKYGLTADNLTQLIQNSNLSSPVGTFVIDKKRRSVVVDGHASKLEDLKKLKIPATGAPAGGNTTTLTHSTKTPVVELQQLVDFQDVKESKSISHTDGKDSVSISIVKASDANTVEVVKAIQKEIKQFEEDHDGFDVATTFDQAKPIQDSVQTMLEKALLGALFAIIIIMAFLRDIRSTVIAVISIPLSLLMAFLVLNQMGITLNVMTLGAMTVAIGRVVDDSIVVIENIYRRFHLSRETRTGKELIIEATRQMFIPILSSTIVTIAVFLPLGLVSGAVGQIFYPFAITIVCALLASLLIAITVVPMMAHIFFRKRPKKTDDGKASVSRFANSYKRILNWSLDHKGITFSLAILLLIGSLFLVPVIGVSFLPADEEKNLMLTYNPVPGDTLDDVKKIADHAEDYFERNRDVETIDYTVGSNNPMNPTANNQILFVVKYEDDFKNFDEEKEKALRDLRAITTKGEWKFQSMGPHGDNNSLNLQVYGDDLKEIQPIVNKIKKLVEDKDEFDNVDTSISDAFDQYTLAVDHNKLSQYGLTVGQVAQRLSVSGEKPVLTTIEKDGKNLDVSLAGNQTDFKNIDELQKQKLTTPTGEEITLKDVTKVVTGKAPQTVTRLNNDLFAEITAKIKTKDIGKANADIKKEIDDLDLPSGVRVEFGGAQEQINESFSQLGVAMLAAIGIVYFILVVTFGGGLAPLAILFSLPFAVIGGLFALFVTGETISVSALIGALMLIGIVVTNAIVLIDRVIRQQNEGLSIREALLEAGVTRLRPILMTAIATVFALLPLAIGMENGGGLISKGLGVTVVGGLISSTLLTLLVVPIVYETFVNFRSRKKNKQAIQTTTES
ncbi:hydrophobic/amphiphilic exporter-1, HAE1 family [Seinonella peptonophila]|uniref:Hydrophobic/amphiphilic exporter-1, HAE1 family n=1 Tax=Seinonella peptonophila TaxID=112248 RepID=A0A1M4SRS1_9BACL|nr:efflux RND transporter permease subunit [Seinonella peptonophila]SHE34697.1 hydrophobic/amphiphilic exporter-1, HAE1 family [Seinonella peptonophila]